MGFIGLAQRDGGQNFQSGGCRDGKTAVLTMDPTHALLQFRGVHGFDAQGFHADTDSHDIRDGVEGANFVKCDLLDGAPVNLGLCNRDPMKNRQGS